MSESGNQILLNKEAGLTSPSLTPIAGTEMIEISLSELSPTKKRERSNDSLAESNKKVKVDISANTPSPDSNDESEKQLTQKQIEKLERQKQREAEKLDRERKKEEERKLKEEEKQRKLAAKEAEKEMKKKKIEEEKLARELKKEEERLEKERKKEEERLEKERKKEEERLGRERKKEEERKRKEERELQRLEKKRKTEEEKQRKEEERKQAEEEKRKADEAKERNQMKISAFFSVGAKQKSPIKERKAITTTNSTPEQINLAYDQVFLPFFQKQNVTLPKTFALNAEDLKNSMNKFDSVLSSIKSKSNSNHPHDSLKSFFTSKHTAKPSKPSKTSPEDIVNALNSSQVSEEEVYQMVRNLNQFKYLQFYENKKPPYIGSWCSRQHLAVKFPVSDPLDTSVTGLDYDYDSDLEWNGDEDGEGEGEDIDGDDDEEEEEETTMDDEDEMEDFVESNDLSKSAKKYLGPLVAISRWNDGLEESHQLFDDMKYERLEISIDFPIDPFHDYWSKAPTKQKSESSSEPTAANTPAGSITAPNVLTPSKPTIQDPNHKHKLILFIEKNNDFSLGTLVELAKKELSTEFQKDNYSKALVKHTIQQVASYNKKQGIWEVKTDVKDQLCQAIKL